MRTTVIIRDDLLLNAQKATGIQEKTALIHKGLEMLIQVAAMQRLIKFGGTMPDAKVPKRHKSGIKS